MSDETVEDWHGQTTSYPDHQTDDAVVSKRRSLIHQIFKMRYGASIAVPFAEDDCVQGSTEATFLYHVTTWLSSFNDVLIHVSDTTTEMSEELDELRAQQTAIRRFLGLHEERTT